VVNPEDVSVRDPTPTRALTLVTCYPFYFIGSAPQRFIVRAVRAGDKSVSLPPPLNASPVLSAEASMFVALFWSSHVS
jgi:Sortase domain